jgi:hypothetical protein
MSQRNWLIIGVVVTAIWYLFLSSQLSSGATACVCPQVTPDTYLGPNWPTLFPVSGCGSCGLPNSPLTFFIQLTAILFPGLLMLLVYGISSGIRKLIIRSR